jgi:CubicO group peptidase (beta-lactamase class C family)
MKIARRILAIVLSIIILYAISYGWRAAPILTAYGAKIMCSCAFLGNRDARSIHDYELKRFPVSLGTYRLHLDDSSATGSILGLARNKAIFRKGLGCTLVNEISEDELRNQDIHTAKRPQVNTDTIPWPLGDKLPDTQIQGVDIKRLEQAVSSAFAPSGSEDLRNTRAILVVFRGNLIAERYGDGFDRHSRHLGWSMTKSVMNALVGILVGQGKLSLDKPAPVPFWQEDDRKSITLNHLMQAHSGLEWVEDYGGPSDATSMLFKKKDAGIFAADHPLEFPPGTVFEYSSGTTNIISWIVRQTVGDNDYYQFPVRELFNRVGMHSMVLEVDAGGTFVGSSFSYATARDWARFGLLYLNDGVVAGERILPEGWVQYSTTPGPASEGIYGAQFWLNAGPPDNPRARPMPDVPADTYSADGFAGQNVFVIPSRDLVVVKLSESRGDYLDDNRFLADIIAALP